MPVDEYYLAVKRFFRQLGKFCIGLPEQIAEFGFRATQQFVGHKQLHNLSIIFGRDNRGLPERARDGGGGRIACDRNASGGVREHLRPGSRRTALMPGGRTRGCGLMEEKADEMPQAQTVIIPTLFVWRGAGYPKFSSG